VHTLLFVASALSCLNPTHVVGQTLNEMLINVYDYNPTILAGRAELEQTNEQLPQARASFMPNLSYSRSYARTNTYTVEDADSASNDTKTDTLSLSQSIFNYTNIAQLEKARHEIEAQRRRYQTSEQTVLLQAITSYLNVIRGSAIVTLRENNVNVLKAHLNSNQVQYDLRRRTNADLAQAKSRLAKGQADLATATATYDKAVSVYLQIVGLAPENLTMPSFDYALPKSVEDIEDIALKNHPNVLAADFAVMAAKTEIDVKQAARAPNLALSGSIADSSVNNKVDANSETVTSTVTLTLTVPIFQTGSEFADVRIARKALRQRMFDLDQSRRVVRDNARQSWEDMISARVRMTALEAQISAAEIALTGVTKELEVGRRTVLDVLDSEQELLDAKVNLATAKRDFMVSRFTIMERTGQLSVQNLQLDLKPYNAELDLQRQNWNLISTEIE
jgi:outer membrane protein